MAKARDGTRTHISHPQDRIFSRTLELSPSSAGVTMYRADMLKAIFSRGQGFGG